MDWLTNGVPLQQSVTLPLGNAGRTRITKEVLDDLVKHGAVCKIKKAKLTSPLFTTPKSDGTLRPIHDLRVLNSALIPMRFRLRGLREVEDILRPGDHLAKLDLKKGYWQLAMRQSAVPYLAFEAFGHTYAFVALPFGLNQAPFVFQKTMEEAGRIVRQRTGLRIVIYLDDWLFLGSAQELRKGMPRALGILRDLGVRISPQKSIVHPVTHLEYLGVMVNADRTSFSITAAKRRELTHTIAGALRKATLPRAGARKLAGKLIFLREAVGPAILHSRELLSWSNHAKRGSKIPQEVREELRWWLSKLSGTMERSVSRSETTAWLTTDAAQENPRAGATLSVDGTRLNFTAPLYSGHVNTLELEALEQALRYWAPRLAGRTVLWSADSTSALGWVRRQGSGRAKRRVIRSLIKISEILEKIGARLIPKFLPGHLNTEADYFSRIQRGRDGTWRFRKQRTWRAVGSMQDWRTPDGMIKRVTNRWGTLGTDLFPIKPQQDSLDMSWAGMRALITPPVALLPRVVAKLAQYEPRQWSGSCRDVSIAVVVAPSWRRTNWWLALTKMASATTTMVFPHPSRLGEVERAAARSGSTKTSLTAFLIVLDSRSYLKHVKI